MESRGGVLSLPGDTVRALVLRLETYSTLGRDWRGLAEWIGFKARHVQYVETLRTNNHKTSTVLHAWDKSGRSSVEKLAVALICLGNIDCLNVLKREPTLRDLDFSDLDEKAARIKASYQERLAYFPHFTDSEVVSDDQWTLSSTVRTAPLASGQSPVCWELLGRSHYDSLPAPARSPDEEHPSLSASPSVAAGVSPSRHKVFCSYYPDSSSTHWMKEIAGTLVANGFTVEYANERRMEDPEFKMNAIRSSYNILVLCTPRYCDEFERLSATPSLPSKVKYDRSLIRQIFFDEQERIICVSVDGACCILSCSRDFVSTAIPLR